MACFIDLGTGISEMRSQANDIFLFLRVLKERELFQAISRRMPGSKVNKRRSWVDNVAHLGCSKERSFCLFSSLASLKREERT
jgi:hypothetical protein